MAERSWRPGMFVWRELMTDGLEAARRFYGELLGWSWKAEQMGPEKTYWLASRGTRQVCGAMDKPAGAPFPNAWSSYVLVDDVDAATGRARAAGGKVLYGPEDIPGVGRFSVLADPWGAVLQPFKPSGHETEPPPTRPEPGAFCWETLVTPEPAGAAAFYAKVIGVGTGKGPDGQSTVFTVGEGPVADVQHARPGSPSYWSTYVMVEAAEATRDRAAKLGGRVIVPRIDVPKVGTVSVIADPSGATLGLFEPGPM